MVRINPDNHEPHKWHDAGVFFLAFVSAALILWVLVGCASPVPRHPDGWSPAEIQWLNDHLPEGVSVHAPVRS